MKVLLIESHGPTEQSLANVLESEECEHEVARTFEEAQTLIAAGNYDVVLLSRYLSHGPNQGLAGGAYALLEDLPPGKKAVAMLDKQEVSWGDQFLDRHGYPQLRFEKAHAPLELPTILKRLKK